MSQHLDESACIAATLRFFRALDARDHAACAAAFAPGGTWHRQGLALSDLGVGMSDSGGRGRADGSDGDGGIKSARWRSSFD